MADEVDFEEEVAEVVTQKVAASSEGELKSRQFASKGRGHNRRDEDEDRYNDRGGVFERLEQTTGPGPLQCKYTTPFVQILF